MTDLEGAVERVKARVSARMAGVKRDLARQRKDISPEAIREAARYATVSPVLVLDLLDTLDALASITRERDEAREENERLHERLEDNFAFNSNGERVAFKPGTIPDGIECRDETIRQQAERIKRLAQERDAMREAHRPYAAVSAKAKGKDDDCWCGQDGAVIRYRDLRLSAALVNGEGGE